MRFLLPLILIFVVGCESFQYRGMSPNVRSFSEDPTLSQYYVGLDFEFNVVDPDDAEQPPKQRSAPQFPEDPKVVPRPLPEPHIPW